MADTINDLSLVQQIKDRITDMDSRTQEDVRQWFMAHTRKVWQTEGAYSSRKWAGYSREPKYRAYKRAITGGDNLLRYPGIDALRDSVTKSNHRDQVYRSNSGEFVFGSRLPFADSVMGGGVGPFGERFPGRDFLGIGSRGMKSFSEKLIKFYTEGKLSGSEWRRP